jgi:hypothetical protein
VSDRGIRSELAQIRGAIIDLAAAVEALAGWQATGSTARPPVLRNLSAENSPPRGEKSAPEIRSRRHLRLVAGGES